MKFADKIQAIKFLRTRPAGPISITPVDGTFTTFTVSADAAYGLRESLDIVNAIMELGVRQHLADSLRRLDNPDSQR